MKSLYEGLGYFAENFINLSSETHERFEKDKDRNIYKVGPVTTQVGGKLMDILRKLAKYTAAPGEEKLVDTIDKLVNRKKLNK